MNDIFQMSASNQMPAIDYKRPPLSVIINNIPSKEQMPVK